MKVLKKKPAAAPPPERPKKKKRRESSEEQVVYNVKLWSDVLTRWTEKQGTRIFGVKNGLLHFGHKKPRSPKVLRRCVPLEHVIQYGGDENEGWVYMMSRTTIDSFKCYGEPVRNGRFITFDLGDGITTLVNADVQGLTLEVVSQAD